MGNLSEKLHLAPDILENTTVVNLYGKEMVLVENYQSIIDYTSEQIKLQGRHNIDQVHFLRLDIDVKMLHQGNCKQMFTLRRYG